MSTKAQRSRYHATLAKRGYLKKLRGKQARQAQAELNQLWDQTRRQGSPPDRISGAYTVAALLQNGECQADDPFAEFWGPIGRPDGYIYYCCTHPVEHCYRLGTAP
jgi:hypothetical protein